MKKEPICEQCKKPTKELSHKKTEKGTIWACNECADPVSIGRGKIIDEQKRREVRFIK